MAKDDSKGKVDVKSLTSKQYLDQQVVPHLLPALSAVSTQRPEDPIQFLADYLMKNNKKEESDKEDTEDTKTDV